MPKNSFASQMREGIKFIRTISLITLTEEERNRIYGAWRAAEEWLDGGCLSSYSNEDFDILSRLNSALEPFKKKEVNND